MVKYWHAFYVSSYKGGELNSIVNSDIEGILDFIVYDWELTDTFDKIEDLNSLTEEDLYNIYCSHVSNNTYALYTRSAPEIYSTLETGELIENFPSKEEIVKYMNKRLKSYKEWKNGQ